MVGSTDLKETQVVGRKEVEVHPDSSRVWEVVVWGNALNLMARAGPTGLLSSLPKEHWLIWAPLAHAYIPSYLGG
jgi:hypothetical protein